MILKKQRVRLTGSTYTRFITILVLLALTTALSGESPYKKVIYSAFITHDMAKWEKEIGIMEATNSINSVDQKLELIDYYYGYIGWLIGQKKYKQAEKMIPRAEALINQVIKVSQKNATAYSYKGSFLGFKVGIDKYKSIFLGPESKKDINKALALDPQNIQANIDKGNLLFYEPCLFGGDKKEALNYFLKGVKLMEMNKETNENWAYLNLLTIIADAYEKTDRLEEAKLTYEKIIRIEPEIKWVINDLYPSLLAKIKS